VAKSWSMLMYVLEVLLFSQFSLMNAGRVPETRLWQHLQLTLLKIFLIFSNFRKTSNKKFEVLNCSNNAIWGHSDVKYDTLFLFTSRIPLEAVLGTDRKVVCNGICWWKYSKIWENIIIGWWFDYHSSHICVAIFLLHETVWPGKAAELAWEVLLSYHTCEIILHNRILVPAYIVVFAHSSWQ
jgi:hypothetical protein